MATMGRGHDRLLLLPAAEAPVEVGKAVDAQRRGEQRPHGLLLAAPAEDGGKQVVAEEENAGHDQDHAQGERPQGERRELVRYRQRPVIGVKGRVAEEEAAQPDHHHPGSHGLPGEFGQPLAVEGLFQQGRHQEIKGAEHHHETAAEDADDGMGSHHGEVVVRRHQVEVDLVDAHDHALGDGQAIKKQGDDGEAQRQPLQGIESGDL